MCFWFITALIFGIQPDCTYTYRKIARNLDTRRKFTTPFVKGFVKTVGLMLYFSTDSA
jgi:hypothetical protein